SNQCSEVMDRFHQAITAAKSANYEVHGLIGDEIAQVAERLVSLSDAVYSKWSIAWTQRQGGKSIRYVQENAVAACRRLEDAMGALIVLFTARIRDGEMANRMLVSTLSNEGRYQHGLGPPHQRRIPTQGPAHTHYQDATPGPSRELFTSETPPNSTAPMKDEIKQEPMEIKEEPIDEEYADVKLEPEADMFCYTTGDSRPRTIGTPQELPIETPVPRSPVKRVAVTGSIRVNRDGLAPIGSADSTGNHILVPILTSPPKDTSSRAINAQPKVVHKTCNLCKAKTYQWIPAPMNHIQRDNFLRDIIAHSDVERKILRELREHISTQAYFCAHHHADYLVNDPQEVERERKMQQACAVPTSFKPKYNRDVLNANYATGIVKVLKNNSNKPMTGPRCDLCVTPEHPSILSPKNMNIADSFFRKLINISHAATLIMDKSIEDEVRLNICRRHIPKPEEQKKQPVFGEPAVKKIPNNMPFSKKRPATDAPAQPAFNLVKATDRLVKQRINSPYIVRRAVPVPELISGRPSILRKPQVHVVPKTVCKVRKLAEHAPPLLNQSPPLFDSSVKPDAVVKEEQHVAGTSQ
ncbi:hypothetical protein PMAYCL1PPCAC_04716, partial [Pristionchus mayeri]